MTPTPLKIAITAERIAPDEASRIVRILEAGFDYVHLRYPEAPADAVAALLDQIPEHYHGRLRLHDHFQLARRYRLGGLHLNGRNPERPLWWDGPVSRSCHTIDEAARSTDCDYVTLSPIFDSISKQGYRSRFAPKELAQLNEIARPRVIALGGVKPDNLSRLEAFNFGGFAVKGAIGLFLSGQPE